MYRCIGDQCIGDQCIGDQFISDQCIGDQFTALLHEPIKFGAVSECIHVILSEYLDTISET